MQSFKKIGLLAAVVLTAFSQFASASVPWTTPSGSNGVVNYSNGSSDNGYFGDPTIIGSTFTFNPSNFKATASNGGAQTTSDRVTFDFTSTNGGDITSVSFHAFGDWSILGAGAAVQEAGALFLTELTGSNPGQVFSTNEVVTYTPLVGPPILSNAGSPNPTNPSGSSAGSFDGILTINLPAGVKSIRLVLNDILQAVAPPSTTAFIQKKGVGGPANGAPEIIINGGTPEPASMGVLLLGGAALLRRRRAIA